MNEKQKKEDNMGKELVNILSLQTGAMLMLTDLLDLSCTDARLILKKYNKQSSNIEEMCKDLEIISKRNRKFLKLVLDMDVEKQEQFGEISDELYLTIIHAINTPQRVLEALQGLNRQLIGDK